MFAIISVSGMSVLLVGTYMDCGKTDFSNAAKNGAIAGAFPSIVYFVSNILTFIRAPFENFFVGFGVEQGMASRLGSGYITMLFVWPLMVWAFHDSQTKACVPTVDEMSKFKTGLMEKLKDKQHKDAATTKKPAA